MDSEHGGSHGKLDGWSETADERHIKGSNQSIQGTHHRAHHRSAALRLRCSAVGRLHAHGQVVVVQARLNRLATPICLLVEFNGLFFRWSNHDRVSHLVVPTLFSAIEGDPNVPDTKLNK